MSFTASRWAWDQNPKTGYAKYVLLCLAEHATETGEKAFPSIPTICRLTKLAERTVRKALIDLQADKLIEPHERFERNGKQLSTEYRLKIGDAPPVNQQGVGVADQQGPDVPPNAPQPVTTPPQSAGDPPANQQGNPITEPKEGRKNVVLCTTAPGEPSPTVIPITDVRKELWQEGKAILLRLTGQGPQPAGRDIGKWLKQANEDHAIVLDALRAAERTMPSGSVFAWVSAAIKARVGLHFRDPAVEIAVKTGAVERRAQGYLGTFSNTTADFAREA